MKIASIFIIAFLCINQSWAGKEFVCSVSIPKEIIQVGNPGFTPNLLASKDDDIFSIRIYNTDESVYTNISSGELQSYTKNGIVKQLSGTVNDSLRYLAYRGKIKEDSTEVSWDFAFFNPGPIENLETRYFVRAYCKVKDYTTEKNSDFRYLKIPNGIIQKPSQHPFIEGDFDNLHAFTNNPVETWQKEMEIDRHATCETPITRAEYVRKTFCRVAKPVLFSTAVGCLSLIYFIESCRVVK